MRNLTNAIQDLENTTATLKALQQAAQTIQGIAPRLKVISHEIQMASDPAAVKRGLEKLHETVQEFEQAAKELGPLLE